MMERCKRQSLLSLLAVVLLLGIISCGDDSKDREIQNLKQELQTAQNREREREVERVQKENEALRKQLATREDQTSENQNTQSTPKTVKVIASVQVNNYKPDGRTWDAMNGAPDISGRISFADGSIITIPKHQNSFTASASADRIQLRVGDQIQVYLEDIDMSRHDLIASGTIRYDGGQTFSKTIGAAQITFQIW